MNQILTRRKVAKALLDTTSGRFISITFIKKDGSERKLTISPSAVKTHLAENPSDSAKQATETRRKNHPNLYPVYDVHAKQIKSVNLDTITKIVIDGTTYSVGND